jgi:hypothetical protein
MDAKLSACVISVQSVHRHNCDVTIFNFSEQYAGAWENEHERIMAPNNIQ